MPDTVADWVELVNERYPPEHAAEWDNVGLQVGDPDWPVERVLVTLDVTTAVVTEAAGMAPALILAHHPLLFRPLSRLTSDSAAGKVALAAARAGVAVLAVHTNLDVAQDGAGTSEPIMRALDITGAEPLSLETRESDELKLVAFLPPEHTLRTLAAVTEAGAADNEDAQRRSHRVHGARVSPRVADDGGGVALNREGSLDRLEVVVPRQRLGATVRALRQLQPHAAYDLHPLVSGGKVGFGLVSDLPAPLTLRDLANRVRDALPAPQMRFAGDPDRLVRRVAAVGGAGESLIPAARAARADVLVTGDLRHHVALDALELGLALVDAGHHATEAAALPAWIERLRGASARRGLVADLLASQISTAPWSS